LKAPKWEEKAQIGPKTTVLFVYQELSPLPAAPAERTFSIVSWTQHKLRKRMNPGTLKDLLNLKHCWLGWLDASKQPPMPLETEGMD
jgi:hypothetical protein